MKNSIDYGVFEMMFGISEPLYIEKIETKHKEREMHIYVNFRKGTLFVCPKCGREENPVNNTTNKTWRTLDMHHYKTWIHFRTPYISCCSGECGTPLYTPPWANMGSKFTKYFEAFVITLVQSGMPVSEVANLVGETDSRLWRFIIAYANVEYDKMDYSEITRMSFDETSRKRGHNYFFVAVDLDSRNVVNVSIGKDSAALESAVDTLEERGMNPEDVEEISIDMSDAFIKGTTDCLPNAQITFDKFHIISPLQKAVDEVRKQESVKGDGLKNKRWCVLKNYNNLTENQKQDLSKITKQYPKLGRAYRMAQVFKDIFASAISRDEAEIEITKWLSWAARCRLEPMKKFGNTVKAHMEGVLHYFDSRITNGIAEGVNSIIQSIKRVARGFKNTEYFKAIIYLRLAGLPTPLPQ
jgi:transposase